MGRWATWSPHSRVRLLERAGNTDPRLEHSPACIPWTFRPCRSGDTADSHRRIPYGDWNVSSHVGACTGRRTGTRVPTRRPQPGGYLGQGPTRRRLLAVRHLARGTRSTAHPRRTLDAGRAGILRQLRLQGMDRCRRSAAHRRDARAGPRLLGPVSRQRTSRSRLGCGGRGASLPSDTAVSSGRAGVHGTTS